jgi:hypothetical protein
MDTRWRRRRAGYGGQYYQVARLTPDEMRDRSQPAARVLARSRRRCAGLTSKSLANIRSDFLAAVKASGLRSAQQKVESPVEFGLDRIHEDAFR